MHRTSTDRPLIALAGGTGYVGGRLLRVLEEIDRPVRCLARRPDYLRGRLGGNATVVEADCLRPATLEPALRNVDTAFYLVHSMGSGDDFENRDRLAARNFGEAAKAAGVKRIVYLGGLGDPREGLSKHLRSRHETGEILRASGVPVIEFRASIILGSGSLSFEMIRALVERLPVMICPRWVRGQAQPIHIQDVIRYLIAALDLPHGESRVFEIGGADRVSYRDLMLEYARQRGLRRILLGVPFLTPTLSSLWLGLTTPVYARVGRKLIESIRNSTVVRDRSAMETFDIRPVGVGEAISLAVRNEDRRFSESRWSDATSSSSSRESWGGVRFGSRIVDTRSIDLPVASRDAFEPIRRIGGTAGWYYADSLWKIRGFIDLLAGGPGLRRGRRDPEHLEVGDTIDFWRVEAFVPDQYLRLSAEMKLPGRAWLEFEVRETVGGSRIGQTAVFDPVGLPGILYWYLLYPVHRRIFSGMLNAIGRRAASGETSPGRRIGNPANSGNS